jgi:hypothetical protein
LSPQEDLNVYVSDTVGGLFAIDHIDKDKATSLKGDIAALLPPPGTHIRSGVANNLRTVLDKYLASSNWEHWETAQEFSLDWLKGKVDYFLN